MTRDLVKVVRDVWRMRGRVAFMALALAAGLTSMGAVLSMREVLGREMTRSYRATVPASATFDVGGVGVSDAVLAAARARPEVARAERRATVEARWRHPGGAWGRAMVFAVDDFADQRLALLHPDAGARVPPPGGVLVERSAMIVLGASIGDRVELAVAGRDPVAVEIAGVVHEPALAPAVTEQAGYFYVDATLLARLVGGATFDELRVLVSRDPLDIAAVEAQVESLAGWLAAGGIDVHEVRVPPPGEHPHQRPSEAVLLLFSIFSALTVVLACILCASLLALIMARQVREVAVMKTIGATAARIRWMYVAMMAVVSVGALALATGPTWLLTRLGIDAVAALLNLDVASRAVPAWVVAVYVATAFALPLLTAAPAIVGASRATVRDALDDYGVRNPASPGGRWLGAVGNRLVRIGVLNAVRVRRRLVLTVALLGVGGGLFVAALSVSDAWNAATDRVYETRHYDVELHLAEAVDPGALADIDGVRCAELWGAAPATVASPTGVHISRTYPDAAHGSFQVVGAPPGTTLMDFDLRAGRWLRAGEVDAVVLNQLAAARVGADPVGRSIELAVEGRVTTWRVVGVVEEVASPATAYVTAASFAGRVGLPLRMVRLAVDPGAAARAAPAAIAAVERAVAARGLGVAKVVPLELLHNAMGEHVVVLIRSLVFLALLMAIVGALALASSMSTSVVERTAEIGVIRAIGGRRSQIRAMVLAEAWFVTLLSLPLALVIGGGLAAVVGRVVGDLAFMLPLPLDISWAAAAAWSAGVLTVSTVAALVPARGATRLAVTDALRHL